MLKKVRMVIGLPFGVLPTLMGWSWGVNCFPAIFTGRCLQKYKSAQAMFHSDSPVAKTNGDFIQMQQANNEKNSYGDMISFAGNPNLTAYVQPQGFGHNL